MNERSERNDADDDLTRALEAALVDGPDRTPPPDRVADIRARAAATAQSLPAAPPVPLASRRRGRRDVLIGGIAASIGATVGAAGLFAATRGDDEDDGPPTEAITFAAGAGAPTGVRTDAALINHTWGVELMLDVEGLAAGTRYDVTYSGPDGEPTAAGSFLAVDVPMHCRFNAARLRADTTRIAITDPDGTEALGADLA